MEFEISRYDKPLNRELARKDTEMPDDRAELRVVSALHEAGHFVAAVACSAYIAGANILPVKGNYISYLAGRTKALGEVRAECGDEWRDCVIDLAGRAITELTGGPEFVWKRDDETARRCQHYAAASEEARRFVKKHLKLIELTAKHFLTHSRKSDGAVNWNRLGELAGYLRPMLKNSVRNAPG